MIISGLMLMCWTSEGSELDKFLSEGTYKKGIHYFQIQVDGDLPSDEDVFSLGILQFIHGIEKLCHGMYQSGLNNALGRNLNLPFLRLPIAENPNPEKATYQSIHRIIELFHKDMELVESTLDHYSGNPISLPIDISTIRIDLNANGTLESGDYFHKVFSFYNRGAERLFRGGNEFIIDFDQADLYWLKGYSHLVMSLSDAILAHDWERVFDQAGHLFFTKVDSPLSLDPARRTTSSFATWADLIAGVHVMNLPVDNPDRLKSSHAHLLKTVTYSRKTWELIELESDNKNEWIPGPTQSAATGTRISREMVKTWHLFLNELEAILSGQKLIPHWRFPGESGINMKKVFHSPRSFDMVLWMQGSAALPYLEKGNLTSPETWTRIENMFEGNFIGFAIWVN